MAELTGQPYSWIMAVSLFPALMYFFSVFMIVHYEARKLNIVGKPTTHSGWTVFKAGWYYITPLVLITLLMLYGYSPAYAAVIGLVACTRRLGCRRGLGRNRRGLNDLNRWWIVPGFGLEFRHDQSFGGFDQLVERGDNLF